MRVAIIGTRDPTDDIALKLSRLAYDLVKCGVEVSTGAAEGVDAAAMIGAEMANVGLLSVYLPWPSFNRKIIPIGCNMAVYSKEKYPTWYESVTLYHPNPRALTGGAVALMARNYGIIADPKPVDYVVASPASIDNLGGTGQGIRIATALGIPLINMLHSDASDKLKELWRAVP